MISGALSKVNCRTPLITPSSRTASTSGNVGLFSKIIMESSSIGSFSFPTWTLSTTSELLFMESSSGLFFSVTFTLSSMNSLLSKVTPLTVIDSVW